MSVKTLKWLASDSGEKLLSEITEMYPNLCKENILSTLNSFGSKVQKEYLKGAIDILLLRNKGKEKFSMSYKMYFTQESLEQSSSEVVARYRTRKFSSFNSIADLGSGIGADTIFLSKIAEVVAFEKDKLRLEMARLNVGACGDMNRTDFIHGDFMTRENQNILKKCDAIFIDPSRRQNGKRVYSIYDYQPSLALLKKLLKVTRNIGIKISPAFNYDEIKELDLDCSIELISLDGECKEAVLWFGELKSDYERKATVLPAESSIKNRQDIEVNTVKPQRYLYEPDGAVIRAHLVEDLAEKFSLKKISEDIAYLTGENLINTGLTKSWKIDKVIDFNLKKLNDVLQRDKIGTVIMKKRGSPINVNSFKKRLKLKGGNKRVLFFTRVLGEPKVIVCL